MNDDDIKEFLLQSKILIDSSYLKKPFNRISVGLNNYGKITMRGNMPDRDSICSFLMAIRPFIEVKERLHLNKIINYLLVNKICQADKLQEIKTSFNHISKYPAVTVDGVLYNAREIKYLYLYGKYFHLDQNKQKIYRAIEETFEQYGEFVALKQIEKDAKLILELRALLLA